MALLCVCMCVLIRTHLLNTSLEPTHPCSCNYEVMKIIEVIPAIKDFVICVLLLCNN